MPSQSMILIDQAERIARQVGMRVFVNHETQRALFMIGDYCAGSAMIEQEGTMTLVARHAVHSITGVKPI